MKAYALALVCLGSTLWIGCSAWDRTVRSQSPDEAETAKNDLVCDLAVPWGLYPVRVESVGLVTGLRGTGEDPAPSPYRDTLYTEMLRRGVHNPNQLLASPNTAMVIVRAYLRPGIQKGDPVDLEVRVPARSETTSLRGGFLLETDLREMTMLPDARLHDGNTYAKAHGPVLVEPSAAKDDRVLQCRGMILGGGACLKSRPLGLVLKPEHQNVLNSARIAAAINRRFHTYRNGLKEGVARAKTDEYIELDVHPRYKDNIQRYVEVVRSVALRETTREEAQRIELLEKELLDPVTSARAALRLEAVGTAGIAALKKGIAVADREVRFHAAEALAYLDQREAAEPLGEAARDEPAFRVFALTALSAMDDFNAYEQLRELLSSASAETRYGAFRALWAMNPEDALVAGESMESQFSYHVLDVPGPPMIHVTRSRRAEVVLFGKDQCLVGPVTIEAGNQIVIKSVNDHEVAVSRFAVGEPDQKRIVSNNIDAIIRAVVELKGTYPDVVQTLQAAQTQGAIAGRFAVDALPEAGRRYDRSTSEATAETAETDETAGETAEPRSKSPLPDLYAKPADSAADAKDAEEGDPSLGGDGKTDGSIKGFFAKMFGRDESP